MKKRLGWKYLKQSTLFLLLVKILFLFSHLYLHISMKIWRSKLLFLVIFLQNCFWPATKTGHNSTNMGPLELTQNVLKSSDSQLFNAFWIRSNGGIIAEIRPVLVGAPKYNVHNSANVGPLELIENVLKSFLGKLSENLFEDFLKNFLKNFLKSFLKPFLETFEFWGELFEWFLKSFWKVFETFWNCFDFFWNFAWMFF